MFRKLQPLILVLLFMTAAASGFAWLWVTTDVAGEKLMERLQTIKDKQAFESEQRELDEIIASSQEERALLGTFILEDENDTIDVLSQFEEIARQQGVAFTTEELNVIETDNRYNKLSMKLQVVGAEEHVLHLVRMLEVVPYHGNISSLNLARATSDAGVATLSANITLLLTIRAYDQ